MGLHDRTYFADGFQRKCLWEAVSMQIWGYWRDYSMQVHTMPRCPSWSELTIMICGAHLEDRMAWENFENVLQSVELHPLTSKVPMGSKMITGSSKGKVRISAMARAWWSSWVPSRISKTGGQPQSFRHLMAFFIRIAKIHMSMGTTYIILSPLFS